MIIDTAFEIARESGAENIIGLLTEPVDISKYEFVRMPYKERWGSAGKFRFTVI